VIGTFLDQQKHKIMTVAEVEEKLPKSFLSIKDVVTEILKDNRVIPAKEEEDEEVLIDHLELIEKNILNIKKSLISQNLN
jgi:hypothetical protein